MCAAAVSEQQEDPDGIGFRAGFRGDVGEPDFEHHLHLQQGPQVACAAGRRGPPSAPSPTKGAFGGCGPPDGEEILGVFGFSFWGGGTHPISGFCRTPIIRWILSMATLCWKLLSPVGWDPPRAINARPMG